MLEHYVSLVCSQSICHWKRELRVKGENPESWNFYKLLEHSKVTPRALQIGYDSKGRGRAAGESGQDQWSQT